MDMTTYPIPFNFPWNFTFPASMQSEINPWLAEQGMAWAWEYGPDHFVTLYLRDEDDAMLVKLTWV